MKRRNFLTGLGAATAGAAIYSSLYRPRFAHAGWGEWPADKMAALLPEANRAKNVLEVFLYGGVCAFDTFYTVPSWGMNDQRYLNAYRTETENRFASCGFGAANQLTEEFAEDEEGTLVHLGPWTWPLRQRPDISGRMRVLLTKHDQLAHEGANPLSLSGSRLGSSRLAGIGSAIQRYFLESPGGLRATPYSWILYPGSEFATDNVGAASAIGLHPGTATPLSLTVEAGSQLVDLLARETVGTNRADFDRAMTYYVEEYQRRFRYRGKGTPTRSAIRGNFEFADFTRKNSDAVATVLDPTFFQNISGSECGTNGTDRPAMQARLAAALLTRPTDGAKYVQWIDAGLTPHPSAGHDTHDSHVNYASRNVAHTLEALANIINAPGENDPDKINLDDTMIVINTEFGRTPERQGASGLNHWPQAYTTVVIGGPVGTAQKGVVGAVNEITGQASSFITPAELRIAILVSLGIFPFSSQTFAVGDVLGGVADELEAAIRIRTRLLGVEV